MIVEKLSQRISRGKIQVFVKGFFDMGENGGKKTGSLL